MLATLNLSSANAFNLAKAKVLLFGKMLNSFEHVSKHHTEAKLIHWLSDHTITVTCEELQDRGSIRILYSRELGFR